MAFGMKHWIGLTTLGLLLVSIWKLPPSALEPREGKFVLPEVTRAEALDDDVVRTHEAIKHMRWSDSLSALTVETAVDGLAIGLPENTAESMREALEQGGGLVDLPEEDRELFRQRIREELAALEPRADVDFGYYMQWVDHGAVEGVRFRTTGESIYLGDRDGQAYCLQVYADSWFTDRDLLRPVMPFTDQKTNAVGACRPYLKYGIPGRYIGEWMVDGASDFAADLAPPADPAFTEYRYARRSFFGMNLFGFGFRSQSVEIERCLAGITQGCLRSVTDPWVLNSRKGSRNDPPGVTRLTRVNSWYSPFGNLDDYLLADLEAEFGPEAFQRFWASGQEVPEAFEAAFGMGLGEWVLSWVEVYMDTSPPGPQLSKSAALGGMLALSIFAALAGAWARRRRVN